jgi:hypothetical protein
MVDLEHRTVFPKAIHARDKRRENLTAGTINTTPHYHGFSLAKR